MRLAIETEICMFKTKSLRDKVVGINEKGSGDKRKNWLKKKKAREKHNWYVINSQKDFSTPFDLMEK